MPKRYEKVRDICIKKGESKAACKKKAARIENALRKKAGNKPAKFHKRGTGAPPGARAPR